MRVHAGALNDAINYAQKGCAVQLWGITLTSIGARVVQYIRSVTGRQTGDGLWRIATTRHVCQFATCWQSGAVLHTYTNVCGVIFLERGILLHFFRLFICVVCGSSQSVTNRHTFWRLGGARPSHCLRARQFFSDLSGVRTNLNSISG